MFTPDWELVADSGDTPDPMHGHEWSVSRYYSPKATDPTVTLELTQYEWSEPAEARTHLTLDEAEAVRRQRDA